MGRSRSSAGLEHLPSKQRVAGSNPAGIANKSKEIIETDGVPVNVLCTRHAHTKRLSPGLSVFSTSMPELCASDAWQRDMRRSSRRRLANLPEREQSSASEASEDFTARVHHLHDFREAEA